jgi:predicted site-specific integrase-resolvase
MKYKISQYAKLNHVTIRTIWNWIADGRLTIEKTKTNRTLIIEDNNPIKQRVVVYARVSSSENKSNLESQKQRLLDFASAKGYIVEDVITEIGSGLNDQRPKLEKILVDRSITHIIVEHKDRLARFGLNYIQKLLELDNRKIEIINNVDDNKQDDLMQDFVSIITSFCARLYGQRRTKRNTEKLITQLNQE